MAVSFPRGFLTIVVILIVLIVGSVLALLFLPRAEVIITPTIKNMSQQQTISLSTAATEPDFVRTILPAKLIEAEAETQETLKRTGNITDDFARGRVIIKNEQDEEQPLLPKSHLKHEETGIFFLTDEAVRIPAQGEVEVGITAKEKGIAGNVAAGRFNVDKLPVSLQKFVYAESNGETSGGQITDNPLAEDELTELKNRVREEAERELLVQLGAKAGQDLEQNLVQVETEKEDVSAGAASNATSITATIKLKGRALVADKNDILSLSLINFKQSINENEEFLSYDPESFSIEIDKADWQRGEARVTASLSGLVAQKTPPTIFDVAPLTGRTPEEVQDYYRDNQSVESVEVKLSPFWVRAVPGRVDAVEIRIQNES